MSEIGEEEGSYASLAAGWPWPGEGLSVENGALRPITAPGRGNTAGAPSVGVDERRPGTGRFYSEELSCFKRVPSPSALCGYKAEVYFQHPGAGGMRRYASDSCLLTPQSSKRLSQRGSMDLDSSGASDCVQYRRVSAQKLPEEERTANILERIYPRSPSSPEGAHFGQHRPGTGHSEFGGSPGKKGRNGAHHKLMMFRQKILDRFSTMQTAFDAFTASVGSGTKELPPKQFSKFLNKHFPGLTREEHEQIFDFLDADKNGSVSVQEFTNAVEAATPVRTVDDLRRKWIALGFNSMRQVLTQMDRSKDSGGRLTLGQFGAILTKVGVADEEEHQNIFSAISDPNHPCGTVSLTELASAVAAVSPSLLLEDMHDRLVKRYGSVIAAYRVIDVNANVSLNYGEFAQYAAHHWKMTTHEAEKAFKLIDVDRSRGISPMEFVSALKLSEPTLFLEAIRRKVRQRFDSIREALGQEGVLADGGSPVHDGGGKEGGEGRRRHGSLGGKVLDAPLRFSSKSIGTQDPQKHLHSSDELQEVLAKVQLTEQDTRTLFELVDINHDGVLTALEFVRGMRLFAPSCVLEDLRLRCLRSHSRVADAFAGLPAERHAKLMDAREMRQVLEELDLAAGVNVEAVFSLVEPHRNGGLTVRELIAALQSAAPGGVVALPPAERDARARQQIRWQMAPFHRSATEFRSHVRQKLYNEEDEEAQEEDETSSVKAPRAQSKYRSHDRKPTAPSVSPPRKVGKDGQSKSKTSSFAEHPPMKQSYSKVSRFLREVMEPKESEHILDQLHGYYSSAGSKVANDMQLLSTQQSRCKHWKNSSGHYQVLDRPLM